VTLRQIGQLVPMSALWGAVFMLIEAQRYKEHLSAQSNLPEWV
jgi:hypothetical protein